MHEAIKAQLYVLAYKLQYIPILEARVVVSAERDGRIDCLFVKYDSTPACAIEVESSVRTKSVTKLIALRDVEERIIISFDLTNDWLEFVKSSESVVRPVITLLCLGWRDNHDPVLRYF